MTRPFFENVQCPRCGHRHTVETPFERWFRGQETLDSKSGVVRFDCDVLLHTYLTPNERQHLTRDLQCIMFVEVKTRCADTTPAQADTLSLFSQVLRNRKDNVHRRKRGRHAGEHVPPCKAYSAWLKRSIGLRMYGGHLLQLSGTCPDDSETMTWDRRFQIDAATLIRLMRFELDPDTLGPADFRIHQKKLVFVE